MKQFDPASNKGAWMLALKCAIGALGRRTIDAGRGAFSTVGGISCLLGESVSVAVGGIFASGRARDRQALIYQMVRVGVRAVPIIILVQMAIGIILPLQMYPKLDEFGQGEQIATINAIVSFRELGPLMTAVVLCGFAGASIAAELATMVTAEEIEALQASALNPVRFLVVPRLLATVLMTVMLTIFSDVVIIGSGMFAAGKLGIDYHTYYRLTLEAVNISAFATGLVKAGVFGLLIGLIACFLGLSVKPWQGSDGVGSATTNTVVYSIVAIIGADAIFTLIFFSYGLFD